MPHERGRARDTGPARFVLSAIGLVTPGATASERRNASATAVDPGWPLARYSSSARCASTAAAAASPEASRARASASRASARSSTQSPVSAIACPARAAARAASCVALAEMHLGERQVRAGTGLVPDAVRGSRKRGGRGRAGGGEVAAADLRERQPAAHDGRSRQGILPLESRPRSRAGPGARRRSSPARRCMRARVTARWNAWLRPRSRSISCAIVEQPPALVPSAQDCEHRLPLDELRAHRWAQSELVDQPGDEGVSVGDGHRRLHDGPETGADGPHDVLVGRLGDADRPLCRRDGCAGVAECRLDVGARAERGGNRAGIAELLELAPGRRSSRRASPPRSSRPGSPPAARRGAAPGRAAPDRAGRWPPRARRPRRASPAAAPAGGRSSRRPPARPSPLRCPVALRAGARAPAAGAASPARGSPSVSARRPAASSRAPASVPMRRRRSPASPSSTRSDAARPRWSPTRASSSPCASSHRATCSCSSARRRLGIRPYAASCSRAWPNCRRPGVVGSTSSRCSRRSSSAVDRPPQHRLDGGERELAADDRGGAHHLSLRLGQRLEPRGQEHLDRARQAGAGVALAEQRGQVLGEQRVALGGRDHVLGPLGGQLGARVGDQAAGLIAVEALEQDR